MYTWTPGDQQLEWATDLVLAAFRASASDWGAGGPDAPGRPYSDVGYAAWRSGLAARGVTYVWGVHVRASRGGPSSLVWSTRPAMSPRAPRHSRAELKN